MHTPRPRGRDGAAPPAGAGGGGPLAGGGGAERVALLPAGEDALLVDFAPSAPAAPLAPAVVPFTAAAQGPRPGGIREVVPAARTVLVRFDPRHIDADAVRSWCARLAAEADAAPGTDGDAAAASPCRDAGPLVVPVVYDGPDLDAVAAHTGLDRAQVIAAHTGAEWTVAFTGFAPGFGYLAGGDPRLEVPRRAHPRTRVPAGSVGLAGVFSGVYPRSSPGGWQIIGTSRIALWDPSADPPALLTPGRRVRFEEAR